MIELIDPEVKFKDRLEAMNEGERKDYLIRFYRQQAEKFRHEGLRLERSGARLAKKLSEKEGELKEARKTISTLTFVYNEQRQLHGVARKQAHTNGKSMFRYMSENCSANKRIKLLKAELTVAHEALMQQTGLTEVVLLEAVMAYNGDLEIGEIEISPTEMREHMADKITIPITTEA